MCAGPLGGRCNVIFRLSHGAAGGCLPRKEDGFAELALSAFTGSSLTRLTYSPFGAGDAQKPHATYRLWLAQGATRDAALRLPHGTTLCPRHSRCTGPLTVAGAWRCHVGMRPHTAQRHPAIIHTAQRLPAIIHTSQRLPAIIHISQRLPAIIHTSQRLPAIIHTSQHLPAIIHTAQHLPAIIHTAQHLPAIIHTAQRPLPSSAPCACELGHQPVDVALVMIMWRLGSVVASCSNIFMYVVRNFGRVQ